MDRVKAALLRSDSLGNCSDCHRNVFSMMAFAKEFHHHRRRCRHRREGSGGRRCSQGGMEEWAVKLNVAREQSSCPSYSSPIPRNHSRRRREGSGGRRCSRGGMEEWAAKLDLA